MKLGFGTVQFGMQYGISNTEGVPSLTEINKIFNYAIQCGIQCIDTAPGYGDAETIIGQALPLHHSFEIITKTPVFSAHKLGKTEVSLLESTFLQSLNRLKMPAIYSLLIHSANDLLKPGAQALIDKLQELRGLGLVRKIGVSIYSGYQIDNIFENFKPDLVQLPVNILDQRLLNSGHLSYLKKQGIEIHARSIYLQGLLLMDPENIPSALSHARPWVAKVQKQAKELGMNTIEAALGFVAAIPEIDRAIVGVISHQQLKQLIAAVTPASSVTIKNFHSCACNDESIVNPSLWQKS